MANLVRSLSTTTSSSYSCLEEHWHSRSIYLRYTQSSTSPPRLQEGSLLAALSGCGGRRALFLLRRRKLVHSDYILSRASRARGTAHSLMQHTRHTLYQETTYIYIYICIYAKKNIYIYIYVYRSRAALARAQPLYILYTRSVAYILGGGGKIVVGVRAARRRIPGRCDGFANTDDQRRLLS